MPKAVVVYESMYGNTHLVADAISNGFGQAISAEIVVVPVGDASHDLLASADVVVVGGPTHAHGMSRTRTREAAVDQARKSGRPLIADPESFLVTKDNHLEPDEEERARAWGAHLAALMEPATPGR